MYSIGRAWSWPVMSTLFLSGSSPDTRGSWPTEVHSIPLWILSGYTLRYLLLTKIDDGVLMRRFLLWFAREKHVSPADL